MFVVTDVDNQVTATITPKKLEGDADTQTARNCLQVRNGGNKLLDGNSLTVAKCLFAKNFSNISFFSRLINFLTRPPKRTLIFSADVLVNLYFLVCFEFKKGPLIYNISYVSFV